jgi:hypothetical protein
MKYRTSFQAFSLFPLLALAGCRGEAPIQRVQVRDSAGIQIVENATARWREGSGWHLSGRPLLDVGVLEGDPEYQLYRVVDARRLSDGRIVVANSGTGELRFYDALGQYLFTTGREGGGPGEFQGLYGLWTLADDSLLTYDFRNLRVSVFDANGNFARSLDMQTLAGVGVFPTVVAPFGDGSLLIAARRPPSSGEIESGLRRDPVLYLRCNPEGELLDSLGWFVGEEWYVRVDEQSITMNTASFGRFGSSDAYEIEHRKKSGELAQLIRKAQPVKQVTEEDIQQLIDEQMVNVRDESQRAVIEQRLAETPFPETMPAYGSLLVDTGGNLWVEEYRRPGDEQPRWTVFDPEGVLLGTVETPSGYHVYQVGSDFVLGRWTDEFEVEHVQLYKLLKTN